MADFALSDSEIDEVRLQLGVYATGEQTAKFLGDADIRGEGFLGAALDFVYEEVRRGMDITKLSEAQQAAALREYDGTADDIQEFLDVVLRPPQINQFRRAVIFRTAGMCAPTLIQIQSQTSAIFSYRVEERSWEVLQTSLFARADEEILRLRAAFPDDAFPDEQERRVKRPLPLLGLVKN